jgi:hypothetical protein
MLQERGYRVHFLVSALEGEPTPEEMAQMQRQWEHVRVVPYKHKRPRRFADTWGADDWYDPEVSAHVSALCAQWDYDLCIVNYAWYSKALDAVPPDTVRIIDTHDAFGDRHKRLYESGTTPEWYFTRPQEEARSLRRTDFVIAIQDEESQWFESLTVKPVHVIGHVMAPAFLPAGQPRRTRLRAGYLASGNPSNRVSIAQLIERWNKSPYLSRSVELHLAGSVCSALRGKLPGFVTRHGFVREPVDFYADMDFSVNPNVGGSGLKIKSVEALGFGLPLFSTVEGMLGICGPRPPYVLPDVGSMTDFMARTLQGDPDLSRARAWSRDTFLEYRRRTIAAFDALLQEAGALRETRRAQARRARGIPA